MALFALRLCFISDKPSIPSSSLRLSPLSSALSGGRPSPAPPFARSAGTRPSIVFALSVNGASHRRVAESPFVLGLMDVFSAFFDCVSDKRIFKPAFKKNVQV